LKYPGPHGGLPPWEIGHAIAGRNIFRIKVKEAESFSLKQ